MRNKVGFILAAAALLCAPICAQRTVTLNTPVDYSVLANATATPIHVMRALTPAGKAYNDAASPFSGIPPTQLLPPGGGHRYPDDLTYQGGSTVGNATFHAFYVESPPAGCTFLNWAACWGNPENFLINLGKSEFIHVTDPYVGRFDSNRYTNGTDGAILFGKSITGYANALTDADMQFILSVFLVNYPQDFSAGENQIYHIFLPPGTDECFDATKTVCYSPDNLNTFSYCGYHSSVTFPAIGHVLYTVEPYENTNYCSVPPGTPNGQLIDGTANILSHESIETITDPDGNAWWNLYNLGAYGEEIGDECNYQIFVNSGPGVYYNPSVFSIHGKNYAVQGEYSNGAHACVTGTDD